MDDLGGVLEALSSNKSPLRKPGEDGESSKKTVLRKRTKTGCLTCRRRRIKCDEGKPICNNCIKSKRNCDGYNQRLTFKEPLGAPLHHHPSFFTHPFYHGLTQGDMLHAPMPVAHHKPSPPHGLLPVIAPKPTSIGLTHPMPFQFAPYQGELDISPTEQSPLVSPIYCMQHGLPSPSFPPSGSNPIPPVPLLVHDFPLQEDFATFAPSAPVPDSEDVADQGAMTRHISHPSMPTHEQVWISPVADKAPRRPAMALPEVEHDDYWNSDDEASMAESEEYNSPQDDVVSFLETGQVASLNAPHLQNPAVRHGTRIRTFEGFTDENLLDTYIPTSASSPLNDPQTAAVFWYFVNVTGPSLSLYERHPWDANPLIPGQRLPKSRQHNWTYTFPTMSFNHPALLQAILAMASLQLAKLRGAPPTAAMKHYHLSLRRVARNYHSRERRTQPATLATTLLLSFYEVWNSDHDKWARHLYGARAIMTEIPFKEMTRDILALKRERRGILRTLRKQPLYNEYLAPELEMLEADLDVDAELVHQLTGHAVSPSDYGHANEGGGDGLRSPAKQYTGRDIEDYEHLRDLYWWYCKMDVYQSLLGGARLFMDYKHWTQCVPRAPCGKKDVIYGTYDHLILLLGRLTDFASKDLDRKRKAASEASGPRRPGQGQSPPMFPGLLPGGDRRKLNLSSRFGVPCQMPPPPSTDGDEDMDLETRTASALREWDRIRRAFEVFRASLGGDFEPLGPEQMLAGPTPFGLPRTYRTYTIAGIWMNYYMGLITLYRAHPSMPPASMVAAGVMAGETATMANEIGRIAAGLHDDCTNVTAISTLVGSAFIESCLCLFVAGIQFQDARQRDWTVRRLHDVARLTGWQSARQIAEGCESAWQKAAQLGRGPPYQRAPEVERAFPAAIWRNPRRIDRRVQDLELELERQGAEAAPVVIPETERPHFAMGLLAVEQDMERFGLT